MFSPTTQMGSCEEPNWTVLYDKIQGIENQITENTRQLQELCDGRITATENAIAKLQQAVQKSESEIDRKSDSGGDIMGHIQPIFNQESCSAKIQPQSEASSPNPLGEVNEHVDANPTSSFSPGLVEHYRDQEGLHDVTIPKNLNEEPQSEDTAPRAAASTTVEPPENEPPGGDAGSDTGRKLTKNVPETLQIPENCFAECTARQEAERRNAVPHCYGMQQQSTNTKRDFKKYIEDGNKALEMQNQEALTKNLLYLIRYLHPVIDDVALYMFSHLVLFARDREIIASKHTQTDKCEHLVTNVLLHSTEKTFWVFMQALEDNNCEFIVDQLLEKANVTGDTIVDIREERRTSEDAQHCLPVGLRTIYEYIFNNPNISRPISDAIRNVLAKLNLFVTGLFRGSILINMKFYTIEQLDAFWMWVKSRRPSPLSTSLTDVILTEEIRNMVQEDLILSLSTDMDLDEYLKKRRTLLHGDLPVTSDDSNFRKHPLKEGTQSLSWLDIAGQPKMEANPKVLLEWAYESGYNDPVPLLSEKFPQTFTGYDEKDFRIERLYKLIIYQNGRISQMNEKCEELENKLLQTATDLKKALDTLEEKNQYIQNLSIHRYPIPAVPVPKSQGNFVKVPTQETSSYDSKQPNENEEGRPQQATANRPSYREEPESVASESSPTDSGGTKATPVAEERPKQAAVSGQSFDTQAESVTSQRATTDSDGSEDTPTTVLEESFKQATPSGHSYNADPESVTPTDSGGSETTTVAVDKLECSGYSVETSISKHGVTGDEQVCQTRPLCVAKPSPSCEEVPYAYNDIQTTLLIDKNQMTLDDAKKVARYIIEKMRQHGVTEDVHIYADEGSKSGSNMKMEKAIDKIRSSKSSTLVHCFNKAVNFTTQITKGEPRTGANQLNRLIVLSGVPNDDMSQMVKVVRFLVKEEFMGNTQIHFLLLDDEPNAPTGTSRKQITSQRTAALEHCREISALTNGSTILLPLDDEGTCQDIVDSWFERTWGISSSPQKHPSLKAGHTQLSPDPNGDKSYLMTRGIPSSAQKHPGLKTLKAGLMESSPDPDDHNPYLMKLDRPHVKK